MMLPCNLLVGCDQTYYDKWAVTLLKSVNRYNPWIRLHVHIVNPSNNVKRFPFINYSFENKRFQSEANRIGYLQCCRFLAANEKFNQDDLVMTLDADSICTRSTSQSYFERTAKNITILRHHKDKRWLAGLVTYGQDDFKEKIVEELYKVPEEKWKPFHDQNALETLSKNFDFREQESKDKWMKYGKNAEQGIFMTLKGDQKQANKYLEVYNRIAKGL